MIGKQKRAKQQQQPKNNNKPRVKKKKKKKKKEKSNNRKILGSTPDFLSPSMPVSLTEYCNFSRNKDGSQSVYFQRVES